MIDQLDTLQESALVAVQTVEDQEDLERLRVLYLGNQGLIATTMRQYMRTLDATTRASVGNRLNELTRNLQQAIEQKHAALDQIG